MPINIKGLVIWKNKSWVWRKQTPRVSVIGVPWFWFQICLIQNMERAVSYCKKDGDTLHCYRHSDENAYNGYLIIYRWMQFLTSWTLRGGFFVLCKKRIVVRFKYIDGGNLKWRKAHFKSWYINKIITFIIFYFKTNMLVSKINNSVGKWNTMRFICIK